VQINFCVKTPGMTDEMYHILSSKIDSMNLEMALIRKEQLQTKQELREAKDEIAKLQGLQGLDEPDTTADDLTDAKGNASTSSVINSAQKAFQNEKAQTKQVLDQIKTDIAIIRSDFNTLMATVATLNGTQINLTREIFEVGRDAKNDIKKVNDTLARAESNHTSCTSLSDTQRRTNDTMSLLEKDVQINFCVQTPGMTDEMYHILSSKIDSMNLEMALIRKEQLQTKQELREAKDEIAKLQGLQVQINFCVQTPGMTDEMYHILSSKIDSMNLEMALIRKEQLQTKQELREAKDEIAKLQGLQGLDEPDTTADDLTDAQGNASTSSVINSAQKAFQNEKAQTKQVLDQIKTDIAIIRSDFNTLMAAVATLNGTQINLTREIFEVGRDAKNDIKKVNDTLA
ncbi:hypothetical protein MAR_027001, partial [Mya arenaria]